MKLFIHLAVLLAGVMAFAGPEDHMQAQVCYNLSADQIATRAANVPLQVCLETVDVNLKTQEVTIYSYFNLQLFANLKTDSFYRNTEDFYRFQVSSVLVNDDQFVCGNAELVTLKITGDADAIMGNVEKEQLKVTVERETTRDTCHSPGETTVYKYNLP